MTKAGVVGRLAAQVTGVPIRVHTFHGHGFEHYYGGGGSQGYLWTERMLAALTTRIVAISESQRTDLCDRYHVVARKRCSVSSWASTSAVRGRGGARGELRRSLNCPDGRC